MADPSSIERDSRTTKKRTKRVFTAWHGRADTRVEEWSGRGERGKRREREEERG
jgi:hypothetical protein